MRDLISGASDIPIYWHSEKSFLFGNSILLRILARFISWHAIRLYIFRKFIIFYRINVIEKFIQNFGFKSIILTASSPELIAFGRALAYRGHTLRVIVWDAPEYLVSNLRLGSSEINAVLEDFNELMSRAQAAAVISRKMLEQYQCYELPCVILRHGTAPQPKKPRASSMDTINIVFAGSLYCKREWNAFIAALGFGKWRIAGRSVRLIFIGRFPLTDAIRPERMEHYHCLSHADTLSVMSEMDIGYLPYWIDPHYRLVVSTSFPSKMTAYAAAGLDVFHHGPAYSSVTNFLEEYPFGVSCSSFDPEVIYNQLEQLVQITGSQLLTKARHRALQYELSDNAMKIAFQRFLLV
ncbi:MAG: hypothetical protein MZV65_07005 [Chromatiales bacterium]|nr:hypothetical protein [Chromatiales bacterium]